MYCGNCGNEVKTGNNFCGACGYNLKVFAEEQQKQQQKAQLEAEKASGLRPQLILTTDFVAGMLKRKLCYLVFYNDRVILAYMNKERLKEASKLMADQSNYQEMKFMERLAYGMTFYEKLKHTFEDKTQAAILSEDIDNKEIYYVSVSSAKFIPKSYANRENDPYSKFGELIIKSNHGKLKFTHTYEDSDNAIRHQLGSFFIGKM